MTFENDTNADRASIRDLTAALLGRLGDQQERIDAPDIEQAGP